MLSDILNGGEVDTLAQNIKELAGIMTMVEPPAFPNRRDSEPMAAEP